MSSKPIRLAMFFGLTCFLLSLTAPAFAQESAQACGAWFDPVTGNPTPDPAYPKFCQGKYVSAEGTETIITVGCPRLTDSCTCGSDGVHCGGNHHAVGGSLTLVPGSCKEIWMPDPNA